MINIKACVVFLYCIFNVIGYYVVTLTGNYGNTLNYIDVKYSDAFTLPLLVVIFSYLILYFILFDSKFKVYCDSDFSYCNILHVISDFLYLFVILYNVIIYFFFGIGQAGTSSEGNGFLQTILPIFQMTFVYYAFNRASGRKISVFLLFLGCGFILLKGWSSHIAILVIAEVIYRFFDKRILLTDLIVFIILGFLGFFGFYYIYQLKYFFRLGYFMDIDFAFFVDYAVSRLSAFSNFSYIFNIGHDLNHILTTYDKDGFLLFKEFFLSLLPKGVFGIENYRALDNIFGINYVNSSLDSAGFSITLPGILLIVFNFGFIYLLISLPCLMMLCRYIYWFCSSKFHKAGSSIVFSVFCYINYSGSIKELVLFIYSIFIFYFLVLSIEFIARRLNFIKSVA